MATYPGNLEVNATILVEGEVELSYGASDIRAHVDIGDAITILTKDPEEMDRIADACSKAAAAMRQLRWNAKLAAARETIDRLASHGKPVQP